MSNDHVHPLFAQLLDNATAIAKPKPCLCAAYQFPHRRDGWCRIEEDGNDRDGFYDRNELLDDDNAMRAADCRAETRKEFP